MTDARATGGKRLNVDDEQTQGVDHGGGIVSEVNSLGSKARW